jgi:hypothetical protein
MTLGPVISDGGPGQDRVIASRPETYPGRFRGLTEDRHGSGYGYGYGDCGAGRPQK